MPRDRDLAARTWTEVGAMGPQDPVALLPVGSTEPHGPHLPLETDVIISIEMARRAAARLESRGLAGLVLPPVAYSVTDFSRDFPGCITLSRETSSALLAEICRSVLGQGFRAVCLVNSHLEPDHLAVLRDVASLVAEETGKPVVFPDKTERRWATRLGEEFRSGACHAGRYESSLVMAVAPSLVRESIRKGLPENPVSIGRKIKEGIRSFREAGSDQAYFGDPASATAAEGEATYEILAEMIATAVIEALA